MTHTRRMAMGWLLAAAVSVSTGCGKSSPTAPEAAAAPTQQPFTQAVILFDYIHVVNDGDLIGKGELDFTWGVDRKRTQKSATLSDGDDLTIDRSEYVNGEGTDFTVYFEASEWDTDLLTGNFRDPDMNKRSKTVYFTVSPGMRGSYTVTLGNDDCKVVLHYTVFTQVAYTQN